MELVISSNRLTEVFIRLMKQYQNYAWTTAWAGHDFALVKRLVASKRKIDRLIVGLHFYQTHPNFIEHFVANTQVRFVTQSTGTFHPKVYLFYNSDNEWEALVGSSNFTNGGFGENSEANVLISAADENAAAFLITVRALIEANWSLGKTFTNSDLTTYRIMWKNMRHKLNSLQGSYGGKMPDQGILERSELMHMSWNDYVRLVKHSDIHGIDSRIRVLQKCQKLFRSRASFADCELEERKFIAGLKSAYGKNSGFFGSMVGNGIFAHEVIVNNRYISAALDEIPLNGLVLDDHYENFRRLFEKVFTGNFIGVATRLLTMKRPDVFCCITSKNRSGFFSEFQLMPKKLNFDNYWEMVIQKIYDSEWWLHPTPVGQQERAISEMRSAFLDAIYYHYA